MYGKFWHQALVIAILFPISLNAETDMEKAYKLFADRENSVKSITAAKEIYVKVIKSESLIVRKEAMDKYGRLAIFEGELARAKFNISSKKSKEIFQECLNVTEYLSPAKTGGITAEYTYWRAVCTGLWASHTNAADILFHKGRMKEMVSLVKSGMEDFKTFDEYGFNRIQAGLYVRSKALRIFDYYHPEKSLALINEALAHGTNVFMNYILKAESEVALGNKYQAIQTLERAIEQLEKRLKAKQVPTDLVPENKIYLEKMDKMLSDLL